MATFVGIGYRKQQGKDTLAKMIQRLAVNTDHFSDIKIASFADPLKRFCIDTFGLSHAQCYGSDLDKNTPTKLTGIDIRAYREEFGLDGAWDVLTARKVLQYVGVDCRYRYPKIWINALFKQSFDSTDLVLITDCRFPDEIKEIKRRGGLTVCIERDDTPAAGHTSENSARPHHFDLIIDNSKTIQHLESHAAEILDKILEL